MRKDPQARIIRKEQWRDYFLVALDSPPIASAATPGQFVMVRTSPHPYPLLRRPFSIHALAGQVFEVFFKRTGPGTTLLSECVVGESLDILGPLGKGFSTERVRRGRTAALIGGGRGIAPLYFLAQHLRSKRVSVQVFYGGQTQADLPLKERFEKDGFVLFCATDDGSLGFHGLVTECFEEAIGRLPPDMIFACGPDAMLERLSVVAAARRLPAELSLEALMGCGFGACWACVRRLRKDGHEAWLKICEEGPVFEAQDIIWEAR